MAGALTLLAIGTIAIIYESIARWQLMRWPEETSAEYRLRRLGYGGDQE